jgi:hypothetical protein
MIRRMSRRRVAIALSSARRLPAPGAVAAATTKASTLTTT